MPRVNFSKDENETFGLMLDLARNQFEFYVDKDKVTKKDLEDELRNRIKNDMLKGRSLYQAYRRNNLVFYEIVEEIVNVTIAEDVLDSPFINSFVEVKNRALGDDTRFYSEGGLLSVASFAGNHWTTDRQSLDVGEGIAKSQEADGEGEMRCRAELERARSQFHTVANDILAYVNVRGFNLDAPNGSEHCHLRREKETISYFKVICQIRAYQNKIGVLTKPTVTAFLVRVGIQSVLHRGSKSPVVSEEPTELGTCVESGR